MEIYHNNNNNNGDDDDDDDDDDGDDSFFQSDHIPLYYTYMHVQSDLQYKL